MSRIAASIADAPTRCRVARVRTLLPPRWARALVGQPTLLSSGLERADGAVFSLVTARIADAAAMRPAQLEERTFLAYGAIARELVRERRRHAVRFWNYLPLINEPADARRDNYMVFNAGRFRALTEWHGGSAHFDRVATASAIGHCGQDLIIHCLASEKAGAAVNNPRQVAPYHYSQRFGPLPPCFARATALLQPANWLLAGGTASVRGEDSVHLDDLPAQCSETFTNLASLVAAALKQELTSRPQISTWLGAFTDLRAYYPRPSDAMAIEGAILGSFPNTRRLEMLRANLCRADLLVEIEGLADLSLVKIR